MSNQSPEGSSLFVPVMGTIPDEKMYMEVCEELRYTPPSQDVEMQMPAKDQPGPKEASVQEGNPLKKFDCRHYTPAIIGTVAAAVLLMAVVMLIVILTLMSRDSQITVP